MDHASGVVAPPDAEAVQIGDAIWQRAGAARPGSVCGTASGRRTGAIDTGGGHDGRSDSHEPRFTGRDPAIRGPHGSAPAGEHERRRRRPATFLPGWRWSQHVKPIAMTASCQADHRAYFISGRMKVVMDDGDEMEYGRADFAIVPPGHDAWVIGDEPCVLIAWQASLTTPTGDGQAADQRDPAQELSVAGSQLRRPVCAAGQPSDP